MLTIKWGGVIFKLIQARLQKYMNWELPGVQAGFRKGRGTQDEKIIVPTSSGSQKKQEESRKISTASSLTTLSLWLCGSQQTVKILNEMGIPDHLTCLLRNLYVSQEGPIRTGHGTTDWFQIGKGVCQGCILSPSLFNLYAEYIMRNARLHAT